MFKYVSLNKSTSIVHQRLPWKNYVTRKIGTKTQSRHYIKGDVAGWGRIFTTRWTIMGLHFRYL